MESGWTQDIPTVVGFLIGIGALAGAILAMVKLWQSVVPDRQEQLARDVAAIRADIHDIRAQVGMLELDVARIDQPSIKKRFDGLEHKIDKLYEFLLEHTSKLPS